MQSRWVALIGLIGWGLAAFPASAQDDQAGPPPAAVDPAPLADQAPAATTVPNADSGTGPTDDGASFQTFYDSLSSQGTWIQSSDYGYVWQPTITDPNWAPYTDGHWAYTDDGWTWVSDEPYGWAVYHYGRWANLDGTGWVWVPGYTWAPAWVSWRYGDGYAGWAPLPPDSLLGTDYFGDGFDADSGYHIGGDCDDFYGIGAGWYIFLPIQYIGYRHYHGYYCDRYENYDRINHTRNVTNVNVTHRGSGTASGVAPGRTVTAGGPQLAQVNSLSATPIERQHLVRTSQVGPVSTPGTLALYAPHIRAGATTAPPRVSGSIAGVRLNRGTDIGSPLAVNARLAPAPAMEAQIAAAHESAARAPASAKVATNGSSFHPIVQAPLTSFHPVTTGAPRTSVMPGSSVYGAVSEPRSSEPPGVIYHGSSSGGYPGVSTLPSRSIAPKVAAPSSQIEAPGVIYPGQDAPSYFTPRSSAPVVPIESQPTFSVAPGGGETRTYSRPTAPLTAVTPGAGEARSAAPVSHAVPAASASGTSGEGHAASSGGGTGAATTSSAGTGAGRGH